MQVNFNGQPIIKLEQSLGGCIASRAKDKNDQTLSLLDFGRDSTLVKFQWVPHNRQSLGKILFVGVKDKTAGLSFYLCEFRADLCH